jgi:hypothetical protein
MALTNEAYVKSISFIMNASNSKWELHQILKNKLHVNVRNQGYIHIHRPVESNITFGVGRALFNELSREI